LQPDIPSRKWIEWTPRHRRKYHTDKGSFTRPTNEAAFTTDEVKAILQNALAEYETHLSQKYDAILTTRLSEQFNNFQKFNEDHVHRQLKDRYAFLPEKVPLPNQLLQSTRLLLVSLNALKCAM